MTPEQITAAVQQREMSHQTAIQVFSALYGKTRSSDELLLPCEACGSLAPFGQMHSYLVWAPMPGDARVPGFQPECIQHYGCSEACGVTLANRCLSEHVIPAARARRAALAPAPAPQMAPPSPAPAPSLRPSLRPAPTDAQE